MTWTVGLLMSASRGLRPKGSHSANGLASPGTRCHNLSRSMKRRVAADLIATGHLRRRGSHSRREGFDVPAGLGFFFFF